MNEFKNEVSDEKKEYRAHQLNPLSEIRLILKIRKDDSLDFKKSNTGSIAKKLSEDDNCMGVSSKFKMTNKCLKSDTEAHLKSMTENRFSMNRASCTGMLIDSKASLRSAHEHEEELIIPSRKIKIRTSSIRKLSKRKNPPIDIICETHNKASDLFEFASDEKIELHGSSFIINKLDNLLVNESLEKINLTENETNRMSCSERVVQVIDNDKNPITSINTLSAEDILQSLIYEYYYDIQENTQDNFDTYTVNNLTIISYFENIVSKEFSATSLSSYQIEELLRFDRSKKILILDLDETLIHSDLEGVYPLCDAEVSITLENGDLSSIKFNIRPYTKEFLKFASNNFNLILFTAGVQSYADPIIGFLDPDNEYFKLRVYRESCLSLSNFFIKDLNIFLTFGAKDMILVDNCIFSFANNLRNGILVSSFYDSKDDSELLDVMSYLEERLIEVKDIREVNESVYGFEAIKTCLRQKLISEGILNI